MTDGGNTTVTLRVTGMHCESCGLLIDETVEELAGVESSATDSRRGQTVVRFDPSATSPAAIVAAIAEAGYQAEPVEA